ncbi:uncharacterized protein SCHCODRAFT_02491542 [Schizophyllum commune H4-8]|uniref:N-acetyltransferase domain-containing protein n=1 Tax=Schizophyllum commune (strain H4-8 / FGSC 9210) TaxID=578458 RepID=D8PXJ1_SCHCM|nr:uncharacterized protein SCHCODRAFT_02491542 [Schizophyllum commune H4-8]KAI5896936.1 hypothetical protein SCHCODRAFT_02491542 [Schizophyllum commune H4-8]
MATPSQKVTTALADVRIEREGSESNPTNSALIVHLEFTATHPQHGVVGTLTAYKIYRADELKGCFHEALSTKSDRLAEFGRTILDNDMNVYSKIIEHEYHRGTGCWGKEMDEGAIVYIESVVVDPSFEQQGIGTALVRDLLSSQSLEIPDIVYCWSSALRADSRDDHRLMDPPVIGFFRKLGFRRVGRTAHFAYSPKASHSSRSIPATKDLDVDLLKFSHRTKGVFTSNYELELNNLLHFAMDPPPISSTEVAEPLDLSVEVLENLYSKSPAIIHAQDERGFTLIYVAVIKGYYDIAKRLLTLGDCRADILSRDNVEDQNAIEALEDIVRAAERGHKDEPLKLLYKLRTATGEKFKCCCEFLVQRRYGCTCGQCLEGWLSPRMSNALRAVASRTANRGRSAAEVDFPTKKAAEIAMLPGGQCIPYTVRSKMNHSAYKGFLGFHRAISDVIASGVQPTMDLIGLELLMNNDPNCPWKVRDLEAFFKRGGKVEHAVNNLVHSAEEWMADEKALDNKHLRLLWARLPRCENDVQFEMVGRLMGLSERAKWGPYDDAEEVERDQSGGGLRPWTALVDGVGSLKRRLTRTATGWPDGPQLNLADVRIECRETDPASKRFVKHIRLNASHPHQGNLGTLEAYKIERTYTLKAHFHEFLDAKSDELAEFGRRILDNDMNVYRKIVDDEYHKGSGRWGDELNEGRIVYVRSVVVNPPFQRQGVGQRLVRELLSPKNVDKSTIVYSWPSHIWAHSREDSRRMDPPIIDFFRKVLSPLLSFGSHPSRSLPASEDQDVDMFKYSHRNGILADDIGAQLRQDYPLQTLMDPPRTMTGVLNGMDGPRAMRPLPPTKGELDAAIEAAYARDSQSIHLQDERGYTPIYVAVIKGHAAVVDKLLSLGDCRADILSRDNIDDQNAIEAQEEIVRSGSPLFKHRALHLLWVLRSAMGEDVGTVYDFSEKRRYGCSCGQCRGGWLSPRMAYLLHGEAQCTFDNAMFTAETIPFDRASDLAFLDGINCIPSDVRARLNLTAYKGFLGVYRAISIVIERGGLPTPDVITTEAVTNRTNWWAVSDVESYLAKGGKAEYAINDLVYSTKEGMADGSLLEMLEEDDNLVALPRCANDLNFRQVGRMMGLAATQEWGPYDGAGEVGRGLFEPSAASRGCFYADSDSSMDEDEGDYGDEGEEDEDEDEDSSDED